MSLAVRAVSVNRGIDPRDATIIAFGGAGPLHAAAIAREIAIPRVVVPKLPGNFSALGMLMAAWRQDFVRTLIGELGRLAPDRVAEAFADLRAAGEAALARDRLAGGKFEFAADLRYRGQEHTMPIPVASAADLVGVGAVDGVGGDCGADRGGESGNSGVGSGNLEAAGVAGAAGRGSAAHDVGAAGSVEATRRAFHAQHDRRYGHAAPDQSIEIVNLRLVVTVPRVEDVIGRWLATPFVPDEILTADAAGRGGGPDVARQTSALEGAGDRANSGEARTSFSGAAAGAKGSGRHGVEGANSSGAEGATARRLIVFDDPARPIEATIWWRPCLAAGTRIAGPAVIEEANSTTFVPPGDRATIDPWGNIVITVAVAAE